VFSLLGAGPWTDLNPMCCSRAPVLLSRMGYLFRSHNEKKSLGRVYGYFPPNGQSHFTISGDKVWLLFPPKFVDTTKFSQLYNTDLPYFAGNGETWHFSVKWPCNDEWDSDASALDWGPDSR
jgi:hypothetical protein